MADSMKFTAKLAFRNQKLLWGVQWPPAVSECTVIEVEKALFSVQVERVRLPVPVPVHTRRDAHTDGLHHWHAGANFEA